MDGFQRKVVFENLKQIFIDHMDIICEVSVVIGLERSRLFWVEVIV